MVAILDLKMAIVFSYGKDILGVPNLINQNFKIMSTIVIVMKK